MSDDTTQDRLAEIEAAIIFMARAAGQITGQRYQTLAEQRHREALEREQLQRHKERLAREQLLRSAERSHAQRAAADLPAAETTPSDAPPPAASQT